jgi:hypothetical protein
MLFVKVDFIRIHSFCPTNNDIRFPRLYANAIIILCIIYFIRKRGLGPTYMCIVRCCQGMPNNGDN